MAHAGRGSLGIGVVLVALSGCAAVRHASPHSIYVGAARYEVDSIVRARSVTAPAAVRSEEVARLEHGSIHVVQVRTGEQPHRHPGHDLVVAVVGGEGVLHVDGRAVTLRAGDVAAVARGTLHWFANTGRQPAVAVVTFMPPVDEPDAVPVDSTSEGR